MKFRHEVTYGAPPEAVFAMLADPDFRRRVCEAQQVVSHEVDLRGSGAGFTLALRQVQDTAGLPAIARKFAGDTTEAVVHETWEGPTSGSLEITAPGKPTRATGTITLTACDVASGPGTRETTELDISVKVPLIGGRLEGLTADNITSGLAVEETVGTAWLNGET